MHEYLYECLRVSQDSYFKSQEIHLRILWLLPLWVLSLLERNLSVSTDSYSLRFWFLILAQWDWQFHFQLFPLPPPSCNEDMPLGRPSIRILQSQLYPPSTNTTIRALVDKVWGKQILLISNTMLIQLFQSDLFSGDIYIYDTPIE